MGKVLKLIAALFLFSAVLFSVYMIHVLFFPVDVVLYCAVFDAFIASFIVAILIYHFGLFFDFGRFEFVLVIILFFLMGYIFSISVPTIIDRSLSFYILEKVQQRGGSVQASAMDDIVINEYMPEHRLVDIRITEQVESGTITLNDGCIRLTPFGNQLAHFSRFFRNNLLPKHRLIAGEYTDDLTDPFRNSVKQVDYQCAE